MKPFSQTNNMDEINEDVVAAPVEGGDVAEEVVTEAPAEEAAPEETVDETGV